MVEPWHIGLQIEFIIGIILSVAAGFVIGAERESRGKPAGISTNSLVIGGSMMFAYISSVIDPNSTSRIASQRVSGIGFLGAGMILKGEIDKKVTFNNQVKLPLEKVNGKIEILKPHMIRLWN